MYNLRGILKKDPDLRSELEEIVATEGRTLPRARARGVSRAMVKAVIVAPPGPEDDTGGGPPNRPVTEAVVREYGRPSLLSRSGRTGLPDASGLRGRLKVARGALGRRLGSVGRIEIAAVPEAPDWGTGWLVAENVIATNQHVAREFAAKRGRAYAWLRTFSGQELLPHMDFSEEYNGAPDFEVGIDRVIYLADPAVADIALLRLKPSGQLPPPIPLATKDPTTGTDIAVVGYPARDDQGRGSTPEMAARIFGDIYDVKRLAPGKIQQGHERDRKKWFFTHDATTLGGNSGSVVLDMDQGAAVGLHFGGLTLRENHAVKASALLKTLKAMKVTVTVPASLTRPTPPRETAPVSEAPVNLTGRTGYSDRFLGSQAGRKVPLPRLTARKVDGAKVSSDVIRFGAGKSETVLRYTHFSVVMRASRRLCYFSAVNIHGKESVAVQGQRPRWRMDNRIPKAVQVLDECYGLVTDGKFSRGHMTRREDPNWGPEARTANADTFFVTNACPQIQPFNAGIWNDLEDYALQNARQDDMKISVFTGPFFTAADPDYFGVRVPLRFWKIIAFIHDDTGKLTATGYTLSQESVLPEREFVYGQFRTYQESIGVIEEGTGLDFGRLAEIDPLRIPPEGPPLPLLAADQVRWR